MSKIQMIGMHDRVNCYKVCYLIIPVILIYFEKFSTVVFCYNKLVLEKLIFKLLIPEF